MLRFRALDADQFHFEKTVLDQRGKQERLLDVPVPMRAVDRLCQATYGRRVDVVEAEIGVAAEVSTCIERPGRAGQPFQLAPYRSFRRMKHFK
jgi:hypothetical protein